MSHQSESIFPNSLKLQPASSEDTRPSNAANNNRLRLLILSAEAKQNKQLPKKKKNPRCGSFLIKTD